MEQLVEILGRNPLDRLVLRDQPLLDHLHRDAHRRGAGALRATRLQHEQLAALEGELDVLNVLEMLLELRGDAGELLEYLGETPTIHLGDGLRGARPGDHVFSLGVQEEIPVQGVLPAAAVARERDAGAAVVPHVAVDHRHHVHRGTEGVGNAVDFAVIHGPAGVPAAEHGLDGAPELALRILGERDAAPRLDDGLELVHQGLEVVGRQIDVALDAAPHLHLVENFRERLLAQLEDDIAVHLHEAPVRVVGEARVLRSLHQPLHGVVVQAEVEDRFHHPRHRHRRARAHRHEQGVPAVAELLPRGPLQLLQVPGDLFAQRVREIPGFNVGEAQLGGEGEAGRHRQAQIRHFGEPRALAAQDVAHRGRAVRAAGAERVDEALDGRQSATE